VTPYTVIWDPDARATLAKIWIRTNDRQEVSRAANQIDRVLSLDAEMQGDMFDDVDRILITSPLSVTFSVDTEDRQVRVLQVWYRAPRTN